MKSILLLLLCFCVATPGRAQSAPPSAAYPRYELEINLDPAQALLRGRGTTLIPAANEDREFIQLRLGKNMRDLIVEVLEPAASAGALTLEPQAPIGENNIWNARPAKPFAAGQPVRLRFLVARRRELLRCLFA